MLQAVAMFSPQVTHPELVMCDNVTGVACSADGAHVLGNYLNNYVYLFSIDGIGLGAMPEQADSSAIGARRAHSDRAAGSSKRAAKLHNILSQQSHHHSLTCRRTCIASQYHGHWVRTLHDYDRAQGH